MAVWLFAGNILKFDLRAHNGLNYCGHIHGIGIPHVKGPGLFISSDHHLVCVFLCSHQGDDPVPFPVPQAVQPADGLNRFSHGHVAQKNINFAF